MFKLQHSPISAEGFQSWCALRYHRRVEKPGYFTGYTFRESSLALAAALAVLVFSCLSSSARAADIGDYTFRSNVQEVRLVFSATDGNGHRITRLASGDVAVVDNGSVVRHFRSFRPASESPLNLVILVDTSDSVAAQMSFELEAAKRFVASSDLRAEDRVTILSFGGNKPQLICARNCGDQETQKRLDHLKTNGLTPLYDAILLAGDVLAANSSPEFRSAMVVFSDGMDNFSLHSLREAAEIAEQIEAPVYPVTARGTQGTADGESTLRRLAENTGGLMLSVGVHPEEALTTVLQDLRTGFVLTYELPRHTESEHWVRILPTVNPQLHLRSRQSYREKSE